MKYGNEEEQSRKLFVGGLSLNTTDDGLRDYFSKYGNLTDCVVIKVQGTNRSKGFGFVTYETEEEADKCMNDRPHELDGRTVDAKRAVSREESSKPGAHIQVKKVFVGGIKAGCDESTLREYFRQFGNIVEVEIPRDRETNNPKGFGFVTFDDFDVTDKLVAKRHHSIGGFQCEVKKALSREEMDKAKQQLETKQRSGGPMRGGRGGGRGRGGRRGGSAGGDSYGGGYSGGYGSGFGGGPMRGKMNQSQRSSGPYGAAYGSAGGYGGGSSSGYGGSYGGGYGGSGGSYGSGYGGSGGGQSGGSGYGSYGASSHQSYGSSNNGYSGYGGQGNSSYGDQAYSY